jgi:DNA polymerase-1
MHQAVGDLCGISRGDGKTINFGMVYGLGVPALMAALGYPEDVCRDIIAKYHAMMPFAKKLYKEAQGRASKKGYIRTIGGRVRRFNNWEPNIPWEAQIEPTNPHIADYMKVKETKNGKIWVRNMDKRAKAYRIEKAKEEYPDTPLSRAHCHTGLNALLQGGAADIIKRAMVDIWHSGVCDVLGAPMLKVHDELNWSVPDTLEGREAYAESNRIMTNTYNDRLKIPLRVDSQLGGNWAECK